MSFWRRLWGIGSSAGFRQQGLQLGESARTAETAVSVTLDGALQLSAVWACTRLISETVASMPINVFKRNADGTRVLATEHPLYILLNGKVNRWQTRNEFFETMTYQLVLLGNSYAAVQRNSKGEIIALVPMMSQQMEVSLDASGAVIYQYTDGSNIKIYSDKSIWHNKLFGNGVIGLSPLSYARTSIGTGIAAESAVTKIYKDGGKPSGVLTIDKVLTPEQRTAVRANFAEMTEGNNNRLFVLEAGINYQQVSLSPQDIELLASRRFQIEDICRFFGVPSVLVNDTNAGTTWGSGIQQLVQGFYKLGLRPYLERYESSMRCWLLTPEERQEIEIEFDFNALLRPDIQERIKSYKEAITGGVRTPDECRAEEGWQPKPGGERLYLQQQMTPIDQLPIKSPVKESTDDKPEN